MKKAVRYMQKKALEVSPPTALGHHQQYAPEDAGSLSYVIRRVEEGTAEGEVEPRFGLGDLARVRTLEKHQAAANAVIAAGLEKHQYAYDNILQGYDVYVPQLCPPMTDEEHGQKIWIIFIHGGYWCDPQLTAWTFTATRAMLLMSPAFKPAADRIGGYASLNYRLSAHPRFPQDRTKTSDYEIRDAKHPDHVNDVLAAIRDLQRRHGFGERYLLCGHGCGATLAMQIAMGTRWTVAGPTSKSNNNDSAAQNDDVIPPIAILGINGSYDLSAWKNRKALKHADPVSETCLQGAFGTDEKIWTDASPAKWTKYAESWKEGRLLILAHSRHSEEVEWSQHEAMERCWNEGQQSETEGLNSAATRSSKAKMKFVEIPGKHAEIWRKDVGMAGLIADAVMQIAKDEQKNGH